MTRLATATLAALFAFCLSLSFSGSLSAQDEKKTGKKPEKMEKDDAKPKKDKAEAKKEGDDSKSEGKAREPADEKQKKQFDKIRKDVAAKFKKGKREQVYVYVTKEESYERIEPVETPEVQQPAPGKGGRPNARGPGGAPGGNGPGHAPGGNGQGHATGGWEQVIKSVAYMTKDPDEAIEKVYAFLVEFPPPLPGDRKKRGAGADEPPPTQRALLEVKTFPATKEGEKQAEAYHEQKENLIRKQEQAAQWKRDARKKGKG